jgi:hypothetical protein
MRRGGGPSGFLMGLPHQQDAYDLQVHEQQDIKVVELDPDPWINKKRREFRGIWDLGEVRVSTYNLAVQLEHWICH